MTNINQKRDHETAVLGGGCFWCLEAVFGRVKGISKVVSGYAGGSISNPNYENVSGGQTGHAETIKISFDPDVIAYENILRIFFSVHDPTTRNRQGADIGPQYRSIILYLSDEQRMIAKRIIHELEKDKIYPNPIVTEIKPLEKFYPAEDYHQKYFEKNPDKTYCQLVVAPKLAKFREKYGEFYK